MRDGRGAEPERGGEGGGERGREGEGGLAFRKYHQTASFFAQMHLRPVSHLKPRGCARGRKDWWRTVALPRLTLSLFYLFNFTTIFKSNCHLAYKKLA